MGVSTANAGRRIWWSEYRASEFAAVDPDVAIEAWTELGLSVHRAGIRKLVIVNSHGGNEEIMGIVARELRVRANMLAVKTSWMRFGLPEGLFSELEMRR